MLNETKPISSHNCGNGKYARMKWGSAEDCQTCIDRKARFEEARAMYAKKDRIPYTDGTHGRVDQDGIIRDIDPVNSLIAKDERPSAIEPYAQPGIYPTLGEIGTVAIVAVMFAIVGVLQ